MSGCKQVAWTRVLFPARKAQPAGQAAGPPSRRPPLRVGPQLCRAAGPSAIISLSESHQELADASTRRQASGERSRSPHILLRMASACSSARGRFGVLPLTRHPSERLRRNFGEGRSSIMVQDGPLVPSVPIGTSATSCRKCAQALQPRDCALRPGSHRIGPWFAPAAARGCGRLSRSAHLFEVASS